MTYQPFLIANTKVGLERDMEPWLLPNDAYPDLQDCYMWRGRIKKRLGFHSLRNDNLPTRLNRQIGTTDAAGNFATVLPNFPIQTLVSHFVVGVTFYQDQGGASPIVLITNGPGVATLDRATGAFTIVGGPLLTAVLYFPGLPVMGLPTLETNVINQELLVAFDTSFAYRFSSAANSFVDSSFHKTTLTQVIWTGQNYQLFWWTNYLQALWVTNDVPGFQNIPTTTVAGQGDGIRWFDQNLSGWVNFLPQVNVLNFLMGCLMILPYKGRLIAFSTWEGTGVGAGTRKFYQRARWSEIGNPYYVAPLPAGSQFAAPVLNAWRDDIPGFGGFIDAPTAEQIVSAEFIKDTLIVYFEGSTWQLRYTGNELLPFIWEKINTELGAESTFSVVPFDKVTMAIGDFGIHSCDSVNVQRIDQKVPDEVFLIQNANFGLQRTYGIRDYFNQLVYWSFPYISEEEVFPQGLTFPNKILVYNYVDEAFSFFNDSFTAFGYFQSAFDLQWNQANQTWQQANFAWVSALSQSDFANIVAGNQEGFVEILMSDTVNSDSLFISQIIPASPLTTLTIPEHNLRQNEFIRITSASGILGLTGNTYKVFSVIDKDNITIATTVAPTGVFTGDGTITLINNISILSKRFNPYIQEGSQVRLGYMDLYLDRTDFGQITVNLFINEDTSLPINATNNTVSTFPETTYSNSPDTTPYEEERLWKRIYFSDVSQLFQVEITMNDQQMMNSNITSSDIVLHGMTLWFSRSGRVINV